jgi:hypothetical protein
MHLSRALCPDKKAPRGFSRSHAQTSLGVAPRRVAGRAGWVPGAKWPVRRQRVGREARSGGPACAAALGVRRLDAAFHSRGAWLASAGSANGRRTAMPTTISPVPLRVGYAAAALGFQGGVEPPHCKAPPAPAGDAEGGRTSLQAARLWAFRGDRQARPVVATMARAFRNTSEVALTRRVTRRLTRRVRATLALPSLPWASGFAAFAFPARARTAQPDREGIGAGTPHPHGLRSQESGDQTLSEGRRHADHTFTLRLSRSRSGGEGRVFPASQRQRGSLTFGRHDSRLGRRDCPPHAAPWKPLATDGGGTRHRRKAAGGDGGKAGGRAGGPARHNSFTS